MPAPGKRPDEPGSRAIRLTPGRPGRPGPARGVFAARGRRGWGPAPGPCAAGIRPGVRVGRRRPARHHHRGGPAHRGAGVGVRAGRGRGARSGGARRLAPWRRSVSARRADPPSASTSAREGLRGPCRVCAVLTESGCRTGPVHLTHAARSRPPSARSISDAAPGSRGGPRPGGPSRFDAGAGDFREDLAAAGLPAGGPRGGPHAPQVGRMRAPESDRRRAGQDGAHHRARQGEPGPRSARCAAGSRRRPVRTGAGWSTSPTCRPGTGFCCTAFVTGPVLPPDRRLGRRQPHGAPTTRPAPPGRRSGRRKHRDGGDLEGSGAPQRPRIQVTCPSPTPDDSSTRAPVASAGAVGSSLRRRRRPGPGQAPASAGPVSLYQAALRGDSASPCKRGARSGATAPGRTATTPGTATAQWVNRCQPHPTPPRQPRRPLTRRRRTPPPSQPHHHHRPARHGITNPPQNPGRSS